MKISWDAIVIGAGLGGLAAAARFAGEGRRVLVIEQNPHPGGTAYRFVRRGFSFPMGPLGFGSREQVHQLLSDLAPELTASLHFQRRRYRLRAFGLDAPLSLPFADLVPELSVIFPDEKSAIADFFALAEEISSALKNNDQASREIVSLAAKTSAADHLAPRIKAPRLLRLLGSIGASPPYASLALLAAMWDLVANQGVFRTDTGLDAIGDALARSATERGAEIILSKPVASIRVEGNIVRGVILKDGSLFDARAVISNADYKTTFLSLLPAEILPPDLVESIRTARQTGSNIQVSIGLDPAAADLSAFEHADSIIHRHSDALESTVEPDWSQPEISPDDLARQEMEISLTTRPGPDNRAAVIIRTEARFAHFLRYRPAVGRRSPSYLEYKTRLARALVAQAESVVPGLAAAAIVMDVATPLTFAERGGRSEGAVAGWSWDFGEADDFSPRELVRTPVRGLYMAGYQAFSNLFMGGVPTALASGDRAARAALAEEGPEWAGLK